MNPPILNYCLKKKMDQPWVRNGNVTRKQKASEDRKKRRRKKRKVIRGKKKKGKEKK